MYSLDLSCLIYDMSIFIGLESIESIWGGISLGHVLPKATCALTSLCPPSCLFQAAVGKARAFPKAHVRVGSEDNGSWASNYDKMKIAKP